jgi:LysM repeat protein/ABC-type branched-subunit amino acid transport system substrate-binding protein
MENITEIHMKKFYFILIPVLFIAITLFSQQNDNFSVKKINGTEYYSYPVQSGEGLFSICRKFNIAQDDLLKINPGIENGLKNGQEILIPINQKNKDLKQISNHTITNGNFLEHQVEKKQTLFGISRKYNISQEDIKKYNPEVSDGLKEGMILKIPLKTVTKKNVSSTSNSPQSPVSAVRSKNEIAKSTKDKSAIHIVQPKETLYSISKKYNVDVAEIIKQNPDCDKIIKTGTELKIPYTSKNVIKADPSANKLTEENESDGQVISKKIKPNIEPIRIAFLLPFMLDNQKTDITTEKFIEFYSGALLAIQEAKELGISFEISYYDTEKSEQKITEILQKDALKNVDLIVGPAYSNQISLVSEFAKENRINTVVPFSSKVFDIEYNPYLFQFNPGTDIEADFVSNLISKNFRYSNIVFVNLSEVNILDEGQSLADGLKKNLRKAKINFSEIDVTNSESFDLSGKLKENHENIIFFNTEKYSLVQPYIQKIATLEEYQPIFYYELNWQNQETIKPHTFVVTPFKDKLNQTKLNNYNSMFTKYFKWSISGNSPRYDLLGYDLAKYFVTQIFLYGTNFTIDKDKLEEMNGIQSHLKFVRNSKYSGFMNEQLYFIDSNNDTK